MEFYPGGRNPGGQHTLMDGGAPAGEATRSRFSRLTERFLGRRRNYVVDPSYQVRSAIIAVLGMAFLLVFAGALFHLLSIENARLVARRAPNLTGAAGSGELRSVLYLVAVGLFFVAVVFAIFFTFFPPRLTLLSSAILSQVCPCFLSFTRSLKFLPAAFPSA